jgi:hypothetical protein
MLGQKAMGEMDMRLLFKAIMMTVVMFAVVNYAAYLQTGRSLWPFFADKISAKLEHFKKGADETLNSVQETAAPGSTTEVIYKWTDTDGVLQYTSAPPPYGISAEIVKVDPNANLMQAVKAPEPEPEPVSVAATPAEKEKTPAGPDIPFPYTPEQIKKTMDDARNVQQMMNDKAEKQQQILDGL